MLAWVVSEETGISPERIVVKSADTDFTPVDLGAYSSRMTYMVGLAAQEAGQAMQDKMRAALAAEWGFLVNRSGSVMVSGSIKAILPARLTSISF